jgi:GPH family glycoside/pentoside/hexuronide:cation symporter
MSMREAPVHLSGSVKVAYGLGLSAEGVKTSAFNVFLLFFYQQIVGLDPALCGLALFASLCIDAVVDPAIGVWSDGLRSRLGRRHPFMYLGILPLALSFYAVFTPPVLPSQGGKFLWLLAFATIARFAMALFVIPHQSLVPELTRDSGERTTLTGLRTVFAWIFGLVNSLLAYTVFLHGTPRYPQGLLNPAGYPRLALWGACTMVIAMTVSALGTQRVALRAQVEPGRVAEMSVLQLPKAIAQAMKSRSYRAAVAAGICLYVGYGLAENLSNYMNTFFWGLKSEQIGKFIFVILAASLVVMATARRLVHRFGNRRVGIAAAILMNTLTPALIAARLLGFIPDFNGAKIFPLLATSTFISYGSIILGMTVIGTMIADVTDEHELATGERQEGLLFSASMFMSKAASGLGVLVSGLLVKLASFPANAAPENAHDRP